MTTGDKEADKDKETLIEYDIKGKEKTPSNSEKKKTYALVMFTCLNAAKTYYIQLMNVRA